MEPRLTRQADDERIIEGLKFLGKSVLIAVGVTAPAISTAVLATIVSDWIAIGTIALFSPAAPIGLFRWWRVKRSNLWNDYWEQKQEKDAARRDLWTLIIPGVLGATMNGAVLGVQHIPDVVAWIDSLTLPL